MAAVGLSGPGMSVSRSVSVSLSIPALSVLSLPEQGLTGREIPVEVNLPDLSPQGLLIPLEVKSNVPWAVTAQILAEERAGLVVQVLEGPEVLVTTEEVPILTGRPGKYEVLLLVKLADQAPLTGQWTLVLRVAGGEGEGARRAG